jgi:hypothetical protein
MSAMRFKALSRSTRSDARKVVVRTNKTALSSHGVRICATGDRALRLFSPMADMLLTGGSRRHGASKRLHLVE